MSLGENARWQRLILIPNLRDFMNILKAFIGVNYLSMAFAFAQVSAAAWFFPIVVGFASTCVLAPRVPHNLRQGS
jgi:hypothetical protein